MHHDLADIDRNLLQGACKHIGKRSADLIENSRHINDNFIDTVFVIGFDIGDFYGFRREHLRIIKRKHSGIIQKVAGSLTKDCGV